MQELVKRDFVAPNGASRTFYFRPGTNDESTIIAVFVEDYYQLLKEKFNEGDFIVDLGSHVGDFAILASTIPGVKIVAVEPIPENCDLIRKNFEENHLDIHLIQRAAWSETGLARRLFYGDDTETGRVHRYMGMMNNTDSKEFADARDSVDVETISLNEIYSREGIKHCGFLKIDIEGAEKDLIAGTMSRVKKKSSVLNKTSIIRGEYHLGDYHDLYNEVSEIFEDCTPDEMNPIKESMTEFLWRNRAE